MKRLVSLVCSIVVFWGMFSSNVVSAEETLNTKILYAGKAYEITYNGGQDESWVEYINAIVKK